MPRGQDAPVQTGGQIDPYVAQSLAASKQQAENRLLAAAQEAGATQRTAMTTSAQLAGQKMQEESQMRIQAAANAASDRRAAEVERARREDMNFDRQQKELQRTFEADQNRLDRELNLDLEQGRIAAAEKKDEYLQARLDAQMAELRIAQARDSKILLSTIKAVSNTQETNEKLQTQIQEAGKHYDEVKAIYTINVESITAQAEADKRLDLPIRSVAMKRAEELTGIKHAAKAVFEGAIALPRVVGEFKEIRKMRDQEFADPYGVLQSRLAEVGTSISVEDLATFRSPQIVQGIEDGKLKPQDLTNALAAIIGTMNVIAKKRDASVEKSPERNYWSEIYLKMSSMKSNLLGLINNERPVKGMENRTVGYLVREGLGPVIPGISFGNLASDLRNKNRGDLQAALDELMAPQDPYAPLVVPKGLSPIQLKAWQDHEATRQSTFGVEGTIPSTANFGGAD